MGNTSASGGYLTPTVPSPPEEDAELDAIMQGFVVGVTGLGAQLVRPRWQPTVPKMPEREVDWCAIGVREEKTTAPAITHNPDAGGGEGTSTIERHGLVEVLASFYGPHAQRYAAIFRDGATMPQNIEALKAQGFNFRDMLPIVPAHELHNNLWFKRYDVSIFLARKVTREYAIQNLLAARAVIVTDTTPPIERTINVHQ